MSVSSDFWKQMNQNQGSVVKPANKGSSGGTIKGNSGVAYNGTTRTIKPTNKKKKKNDNVSDEFWSTLQKNSSSMDVYNRFAAKDDDIAPVITDEEEERTWFQKGAFEDGFDWSDIPKTILGTVTDTAENLGAGIMGMGEKALDAAAWLAPYAMQGQYAQMQAEAGIPFSDDRQKIIDEAVEDAKKQSAEFIAKDLYDEEQIAKAIISDPVNILTGVDAEADSVFGEKSDALIQSAGQLAGQYGLTLVGVPWFVTSAATSFGSEVENALNEGATYGQAGASGAITAGAEILSEKMFGGDLFVGKSGSDLATRMLSTSISDKAWRTFAKLGIDSFGEGFEEVFSDVVSKLGSSLYKEEDLGEILFSEQALDEYIESFFGGAVLGDIMVGVNAVKAVNSGVDFTSGLTENEETVVQKIYKEELAKEEKKGFVSEKKKTQIYDSIIEKMDKGYISIDTIEETLGGNTYKAYKNTIDSEDAQIEELQNQLDDLDNAPNTIGNARKYDAIATKLEELKKNSQRDQLKLQLSEEVYGLVKGDRLFESYNEQGRKGQVFEADLNQYDEKQRAVVQKAIDSGILNNTNRTHEFVDIIAKISADKGVLFDFTNNQKLKDSGFAIEGKQVNGFVTKDGITLNIDSPKAWQSTVGHEITHVLEGTEFYNELQKTLFDYAESRGELGSKWSALKELYKDVKDADVNKELTADLVGEYLFADSDFINNLSANNRNVFQKIYDEIKYLYKVATAGSKEARELEKVKKAFDEAYRANVVQKNTANSGVNYSIETLPDGKKYVRADRQVVFGNDPDSWSNQVEDYINGKIRNGENISLVAEDGEVLMLTSDTAGKIASNKTGRGTTMDDETFAIKANAGVHIDELAQTSVNAEPNKKAKTDKEARHGSFAEGGWNYRTAFFRDFDGKYYRLTISVAKGSDGNVVYNIGKIEERSFPNVGSSSTNGGAKNGETSFEPKVAQKKTDVKRQYSISDSTPINEVTEDGLTMTYVRVPNQNTQYYGSTYGQNIEPAGEYMSMDTMQGKNKIDGYEYGTIQFKKPLVLEHINTSDTGWKKTVSDMYGGLTGKKLTKALIKDGYDAIVTYDDYGYSEVVNLNGTKLSDPNSNTKYSISDSTGKQLTKEQQEFFKDSKVRDENGNLMAVYHGTYSDFNIFNIDKTSTINDLGKGHYFTSSYDDANANYASLDGADVQTKIESEAYSIFTEEMGYSEDDLYDNDYVEEYNKAYDEAEKRYFSKPRVIKSYLNITNPIIIREDGDYDSQGNKIASDADRSSYDGMIDYTVAKKFPGQNLPEGTVHFVVYDSKQIKSVHNTKPTDNPDIHRSLSKEGEQFAPVGNYATPATDLRLETAPVKEAAPVAENATTTSDADMFPDDGEDVNEELENLQAEEAEIRAVMDAYAGVGDIEAVNKLIPEHEAIQARIRELQQTDSDRVASLGDADAPPEIDAPYYENQNQTVTDPFENRNWNNVVGTKNRKVKAYMYEHPEVKSFFQAEAQNLLGELSDTQRGEKFYNDEVYYESGGEKGWSGVKRLTSQSMETMLDSWGMSYDEIQKGLEAIIEDNGAENIAAAKKVEFMLNDRLLNGYKNFYDRGYVEPNQGYINLVKEMEINAYSEEAFDSFMQDADSYAPEDIAPTMPLKKPTPDTMDAPIFDSKDPKALRGQTSLFEEKKTVPAGGKVARVTTEEETAPKRRGKFWSLIKEHVFDNGMVFEDLSKETGNREIEAKWNFIRYSRSRAQRLIGNGTDGVKALKDIKKTVDASGKTEQFYDYLYHKHNVDRMSLEDRFDNTPNKAVFGDSVTSEMSQMKAEQYEKANPEFLDWAEDVYGYMNHLRDLLVENDVISQETADLWEKMYPHYVPIRRKGMDGLNINVPLDSRRTTVNNPIKRATGGNQDILDLFNTMAQRTNQTYKAIARNNFGIELKNQLGSVVEKNAPVVDDVIDGIDTDDAFLKPGENGTNPTFTVFENGERVEFEITEEMYEAMKPKSEALQYRNKILNTASSVFRGLTTQYSIPFMATNAIKDAQDVLINSQHPAKTYANFPRAWAEQLVKGKYYREYVENGGEDNTYFDNETNAFHEDNWFMKGVKMPLNVISTMNNFIELTPRLSEYIASREAGRSIETSMLDAARVTTNFAAGGDLTKFLNSNGATFLNASVQGAVQQVRNIREAHHKGLMGYVGLATKFALAGLPAVLLNNGLWDDDEDYEDLADYVKQDYYILWKYDDGKFFRIPKGRTVAVIQNAIEQVQNAATGDDEVDLKAFLTLAVNNLAPNNPLENNILAPIMQAARNETWYGEELVPSRLQDLPAAEQFDEKTDSFSKKLGEALDVSPYKINYLLNQYSGGIGDLLLPMATPRAESGDDSLYGTLTAPLRDKFTTDSVINSQVVSDFYDTQDELQVLANSSKATEDDYFRDLYMDTVGWEMSDLYKQKREIQNSDLSDAEKYNQTREIQGRIVERMKQALNSYNNINASGNYAEVGDKRYNKDADSGKWYEIKAKNADGSDNWYYQKEQEVTQGLGISYEEYWNNREEYNYAYDKPGKYALAQAVGGYDSYMEHYDVLENWQSDSYLSADKDSQGSSISGSRKEKVIDYINGLDADYGTKIILYRSVYDSKADKRAYNQDIVDYLNSRDDISYEQMEYILKELGFEVDSYGNISW